MSDRTSDDSQHQFAVAPLRGRHVVLRQVMREDYPLLRAAETSGELGIRWRYRGRTPSPEEWAQTLWQGVIAQFIVVSVAERTPLGLVMAYRTSFQDGHAWLGAETFGDRPRSPRMVFGIALFVDYVFRCWNFHKLYCEVPEYNLDQFESGIGRVFSVEGRLRDHIWYDGQLWDQVLLALYRDTWQRESRRVLAAEHIEQEMMLSVRWPRTGGVPSE